MPVHDDRKQLGFLTLEAMQCGLSWDTVLRKREIFRGCFDGFDFDKVAAYIDEDVDRIARDLKKRVMKYIGSVTVCAQLQTCGLK